MKEIYRQLTAGAVAAGGLIGMSVWSDFGFWVSLIISALVGLGTYFSMPRKKTAHEIEVAPGITKAQLNNSLSVLNEYIEKFKVEEWKCPEKNLETIIENIRKVLESIYQKFRQDPEDINKAYHFLDKYLEKSYKLVSQYNRLAEMAPSNTLDNHLDRAEQDLHRVLKGLESLYAKCLQDDLMDLEVESETLAAILEMDQPLLNMPSSSDQDPIDDPDKRNDR